MASQYKTSSLDEMSDAYDAQQATEAAAPAQQEVPTPAMQIDDGTQVQPSVVDDGQGQAIPQGWSRGRNGAVLDPNGEATQVPFDPNTDKTPGFFGALKDAYKRSSLGDGNNAFNNPSIYESLSQSILNRLHPQVPDPKRTFVQNVGADLVALGAGLPIALSHPIETAKTTLYGGQEGDPFMSRVKQGAIVQSIGQVFDKQYYKEHPGLAAVNTGSWIATVFTLGLSKALGVAAKAGITQGVEEAALVGTEQAGAVGARAATQTATELAFKTASKPLTRAVEQAFKSGDTGIVQEVAQQALKNQGLDDAVAARISQKVADGVQTHFTENATKLKVYNAGAHPLSSLSDAAGAAVDPLKKVVFGDSPNSAVGRVYGSETVSKNPQGFLDIEKWAGQQAEERGLKNTVNNRETIMNEWSNTVSEWSVLSPEERVQYHQNYVRASELAQQVAKVTGDAVVPTKFLAPDYVEAIKQTIQDSPASMSPTGILDELQTIYGSDIKLHRASLDALLAKEPTRDALMSGIEALGNRETLSYNNLPKAKALVRQLEDQTGYRLVEAPTNKPVSYATREAQTLADAESTLKPGTEPVPAVSELTKTKTKLGQMLDKLGLSATGGNEGSLEYLFQDNFNQAAVKDLTAKYGGTFTVDHQTVPFSKLYDFLSSNRSQIFERKDIAGSISQILAPGSGGIADMTVGDLVTRGFSKPLAEDIVGISKKALIDLPMEKTGLADGFVNLLKAKVPGYSKFLNVAMNGRFNVNPFYGMQAWIEMEFNKATALGADPAAIAKSISFGERTDNFVGGILQKIPYLRDAVNPPLTYSEIQLAGTELLGDMHQNTLTAASNPEMAMLQRGASVGGSPQELQAYAKSIQSKNVTFRALGYTTQRAATGFAKALAEKYGFSLEEALGSKIVDGRKVYNNPDIFNTLREATQDLTGYKPGFLTSPLAKTMNVIWFPFRFEAKTIAGVAEAIGKLPPLARIGVMSDWTHFSNWAVTPEGVKWRQDNSHKFYNLLNYVFTWESSGKALKDVLDGRLFGGATGQLGGLPLGFISNIAQNIGIMPDYPQEGKKGFSKQIPKEIISAATARTIMEGLVSHVMPKMPLYSLLNITTTPDSVTKGWADGLFNFVWGHADPKAAKKLKSQFKSLKPGDTRF